MKENGSIVSTERVLYMKNCPQQKEMCWGYDGIVFVHKDTNPTFDKSKPFMVLIHQMDDEDGELGWQIHLENFGATEKNPKVLYELYSVLTQVCDKHIEIRASGGCTPGGLSGISRLQDCGFKKVFDDSIRAYWGGELDDSKLIRWLNCGQHENEFLVQTNNGLVSSKDYAGEFTKDNTRPRAFKMVREANLNEDGDVLKMEEY